MFSRGQHCKQAYGCQRAVKVSCIPTLLGLVHLRNLLAPTIVQNISKTPSQKALWSAQQAISWCQQRGQLQLQHGVVLKKCLLMLLVQQQQQQQQQKLLRRSALSARPCPPPEADLDDDDDEDDDDEEKRSKVKGMRCLHEKQWDPSHHLLLKRKRVPPNDLLWKPTNMK